MKLLPAVLDSLLRKSVNTFLIIISQFRIFFLLFLQFCTGHVNKTWAAAQQNQQNYLCAQRSFRSALASAQSHQSSLSVWRNLGSLATHLAHSEDSDQTGWMPRLIGAFARHTGHFVGFVDRRLNQLSLPFCLHPTANSLIHVTLLWHISDKVYKYDSRQLMFRLIAVSFFWRWLVVHAD